MLVPIIPNPDPNGPDLVVITHDAYRFMADALADAAGVRRGGVPIPASVAEAVGRGVPILQAVREFRGVSQLGLSKLTGIGQASISQIERRNNMPRDQTRVVAFAKALDVPPEWLT